MDNSNVRFHHSPYLPIRHPSFIISSRDTRDPPSYMTIFQISNQHQESGIRAESVDQPGASS
jgi:hypothetical protein